MELRLALGGYHQVDLFILPRVKGEDTHTLHGPETGFFQKHLSSQTHLGSVQHSPEQRPEMTP